MTTSTACSSKLRPWFSPEVRPLRRRLGLNKWQRRWRTPTITRRIIRVINGRRRHPVNDGTPAAAALAPVEEDSNAVHDEPLNGANAENLATVDNGVDDGKKGKRRKTLGNYKCVSCEGRFQLPRYLQTHVASRSCTAAQGRGWQCTRCGDSGDDEWLQQHDSIKHREAWLSKYRRM